MFDWCFFVEDSFVLFSWKKWPVNAEARHWVYCYVFAAQLTHHDHDHNSVSMARRIAASVSLKTQHYTAF